MLFQNFYRWEIVFKVKLLSLLLTKFPLCSVLRNTRFEIFREKIVGYHVIFTLIKLRKKKFLVLFPLIFEPRTSKSMF